MTDHSSDLLKLIKQCALDAMMCNKLADITLGNVISVNPLKIRTTEGVVLEADDVILTKNVRDYDVTIRVYDYKAKETIEQFNNTMNVKRYSANFTYKDEHCSGGESGTSDHTRTENCTMAQHDENITMNKHDENLTMYEHLEDITVYNHLVLGDKVILISYQNEQSYIVLDTLP